MTNRAFPDDSAESKKKIKQVRQEFGSAAHAAALKHRKHSSDRGAGFYILVSLMTVGVVAVLGALAVIWVRHRESQRLAQQNFSELKKVDSYFSPIEDKDDLDF